VNQKATHESRSEYVKPRLVDYGSLKQLVLQGTKMGSSPDAIYGTHKELITSLP
jgi:hypothetical protein